jgi:hypothetical protein
VESVSLADAAPFSNNESASNVSTEGYTAADGEDMSSDLNSVGPGFFRTLGAALVAGREFTDRDVPGAPKVAIVNQAFVKSTSEAATRSVSAWSKARAGCSIWRSSASFATWIIKRFANK